MAIRIKLRDGTEALIQATMAEWQEAVQAAMREQKVLEIEQPDGRVVIVKPQEIQYYEEDPAAAPALEDRFRAATVG